MIIDGVKWACDACIRGHRVSGCTHSDRELKQIAKKGRPVSQCPHCRHLRKSRSAHVKCDCGDRHSHGKDQAAKKVGNGGCCGPSNNGKGDNKPTQCTCCHGGRCTCALKKEAPSLATVPEFTSPLKTSTTESRRPRIHSTQSETALTTFTNGHHKPTYKSHHSHGTSPYTLNGHMDHPRPSFLDDDDIHPPMVPKTRRMKSSISSTDLVSNLQAANNTLLALGQSRPLRHHNRQTSARMQPSLSVNTTQAQFNLHENFNNQDYLQSADSDAHQFSAGLYPSAGWPTFHFDFDWIYPSLTNSSSGDENDEQSLHNTDIGRLTGTGPLPSEASDLGDDSYRLSASSSFIGLPQAGLVPGSTLDMEGYLYMPESTKLNLERYLSDSSPQNNGFMDAGLNLTLSGDGGYDVDTGLYINPFHFQHTLHGSTDNLELLSSSITSPAESVMLNMPTPVSTEDEMIWMRKFSNASNPGYAPSLDNRGWGSQPHSQCQSPR